MCCLQTRHHTHTYTLAIVIAKVTIYIETKNVTEVLTRDNTPKYCVLVALPWHDGEATSQGWDVMIELYIY